MKKLVTAIALVLLWASDVNAWCIQQNEAYCDSTFGSTCWMGSPNQKCFYDGGGCRTGCGNQVVCDPFDPFC